MAGDWIKIEHATADKPEVGRIAEKLGIDHDAALGKVLRFWMWADQQSESGNTFSVTKSAIDRVTYCPGFADALLEVDWLQTRSGSFAIPRFDRHNGQTAKQRAETNRRVSEHRKRKCNDDPLQKPLPEKRREEKRSNAPLPPEGEWGGVLPSRWRNIPKIDRRSHKCLKNSPLMERIGAWFGRRAGTIWPLAEGITLHAIEPHPDDVDLLESYYFATIHGELDFRRRDLATLLNNWQGEVDRARIWKAEQ